ncbi:MAG TPA: class I SAM-dependent methyltransferase [Gaiellaceae bacterium]|nr:class I SAM-dependent methyltransferase [Gaiellaceae bacterium]
MTLSRSVADVVRRRAPNAATAFWLYLQLRRQDRELARASGERRSPRDLVRQTPDGRLLEIVGHDLFDVRVHSGPMTASQKLDEIVPLLERVERLRPQRVCEIGSSAGGTLYLLTRVSPDDAVIVSVDHALPDYTRRARSRMARGRQRVVGIEGDSHSEETKRRVIQAVEGEPLDFLFIDGDHSYEGVRADYELYAPLVRAGGMVALHDVNPDFRTSRGVETPSISGDVPHYWSELKERHRCEELIAEPGQDGYGIGIVYV